MTLGEQVDLNDVYRTLHKEMANAYYFQMHTEHSPI